MATATTFDNEQPIVSRRKILKGLAANTSFILPAGASLRRVIGANRAALAVTGGLKIGITNGGTEVLVAQPVAAAGADGAIFDAPLLNPGIKLTAQTLYIQAVTAWNGAVVDLAVEYIETNTQY